MKTIKELPITLEAQTTLENALRKHEELTQEITELEEQLAQAEKEVMSLEWALEEAAPVDIPNDEFEIDLEYLTSDLDPDKVEQLNEAEATLWDLERLYVATKAEAEKVEQDLTSYVNVLESKYEELGVYTQMVKECTYFSQVLKDNPEEWESLHERCANLFQSMEELINYVDERICMSV